MRRLLSCAAALAATAAAAQQETITVTATRIPQAGYDVPAAIDAVDARVIREDNAMVNLSEALNRVPGIVVQNRQNYAQDLQISSRGFGGRATFGVRGVRLIADGIPATMPDGQGQAATFDLASAERIEVLRGPFASMYGNSSGGVVQVFTADGVAPAGVDAGLFAGSHGMRKANLRVGGDTGAVNYVANASRFETDGYRDHSQARRDQWNAKVRLGLGPGALTLVANGLDQPGTQDPLGLTRAQFEADPRQADASATAFDTRKSIRQLQGGASWDARLSHCDTVNARLYSGARTVVQYLGQAGDTPLSSGGVVDLDRIYGGAGMRWTHVFIGPSRPLSVSYGFEHDRLEEHRTGFVNEAGRAGALKRDEDDTVSNTDFYVQAEWAVAPRWSLSAGARSSRVKFDSADHYVTAANPDDSGGVTHSRTTKAVGAMFKASPALHLYANAGEGFETPTFAELAYRPGGATGLNLELQPAKSRHVEIGAKARPFAGLRLSAALYRIDTRDEIVTNTSAGGRTDFKNASRTRRDGVELALEARLGGGFEANLAYSGVNARFTEDFASGSPPVTVAAGRKLPGVPRHMLFAEGVWRHAASGFHAAVEVRHAGRVYVNEANIDAASAYTIGSVRAGFEQQPGAWRFRQFVRVENVTGREYAGSVIVAEARGRFFEPAPGRNWLAGAEASYTF
jgi:iron complex outermembrane receptor protein